MSADAEVESAESDFSSRLDWVRGWQSGMDDAIHDYNVDLMPFKPFSGNASS
jgi:hypothetical protein